MCKFKKKILQYNEFLEIEKEFHDNYAKCVNWDKPVSERLSYETENDSSIKIEKRFIKMLGNINGKRILDIGSGSGNAALYLAKKGGIVTSIDIAPELIKGCKFRAQKNELTVDFQVMDAQYLKFTENSFDIIIGFRTIHHLQNIYKFLNSAFFLFKKRRVYYAC